MDILNKDLLEKLMKEDKVSVSIRDFKTRFGMYGKRVKDIKGINLDSDAYYTSLDIVYDPENGECISTRLHGYTLKDDCFDIIWDITSFEPDVATALKLFGAPVADDPKLERQLSLLAEGWSTSDPNLLEVGRANNIHISFATPSSEEAKNKVPETRRCVVVMPNGSLSNNAYNHEGYENIQDFLRDMIPAEMYSLQCYNLPSDTGM